MTTDAKRYEVVIGDLRGHAVGYHDGQLALVVPRAFAPGKPVALLLREDAGELALEGKSLGSKRDEAGAFRVGLKLVNLRRGARARLEALFG